MPAPNGTSCSHHVSVPINCSSRGSLAGSEANGDASTSEKVNINVLSVLRNPPPSNPSDMVKTECAEDMSLCAQRNGMNDFSGAVVPAVKAKESELTDFEFDELDHVVLKDRQKLLLKRKLLEAAKLVLEGNSVSLSKDLAEASTRRIKEEPQSDNGESELLAARDQIVAISERNASDLCNSSANGPLSMEQSADRMKEELHSVDDKLGNGIGECGRIYQPERNSVNSSTVQASVKVKVEPSDNNDLQNPSMKTVDNLALGTIAVKSEVDISDVDHMPLRNRLKLPTSADNSEMSISVSYECLGKTESATLDHSVSFSEYAKPKRVGRPRKKRKTAMDSIETALEEDAPGLLKVLVDQGVSVDEIKLYGEESTDALDESFSEESFSELEAVITKLFTQRNSFLKFAPIRCAKESRPSYCLACLFSLVEQTRYLQFRKWPVEWGWCRDLQSFIFVFERHHRVVVERPEYGFATFFFELVDSLPIEWQVKRLVTAMKLTSCGRITLIENKPLSVGDDLSEGEAKVLMEYGWIPGTGLGTMLNYRDRVVHDRKNESDSSEWRSKIGKLLMDGYCGGTVVSTSTVNELEETAENAQQVKMEPLI